MPVIVKPAEYIIGDGRIYALEGLGSREVLRTEKATTGYHYQNKNRLSEQMWPDSAGNLYRGRDTSPDATSVYTLYTRYNGGLRYGSIWTPPTMTEGQFFRRDAHVVWQKKADGSFITEYDETTHIQFFKHHVKWTSKGGIVLDDVIELRAFSDIGGKPNTASFETYFYWKKGGLVGWRGSAGESYIAAKDLTEAPLREAYPWIRDITPPPVVGSPTAVGKPNPAGEAKAGVLAASYNVRSGPGTNYAVKMALLKGASLVYYPDAVLKPSGQSLTWVWIEAPSIMGWMASEGQFLDPAGTPSMWPKERVVVPVWFTSQRDTGLNNCGEAALAMMVEARMYDQGIPGRMDVMDIIDYVGNNGGYASIQSLLNAADDLDIPLKYQGHSDETIALTVLATNILYEKPVLCLVERGKLPGSQTIFPFTGAHYVVVYGLDVDKVLYFDPLGQHSRQGAMSCSPQQFAAAWRLAPGNNATYQSILIDED